MPDYTKVNLKDDVEDQAPKFGFAPDLEAHFATKDLELQNAGVSYQKLAPGFRIPFGHRHEQQEEIYVLVGGSAKIKVDDEVVELRQWDAIRLPADVMRAVEGGPEGAELLAFGAPYKQSVGNDAQMAQGWWSD
jgi:mannose-6-phosphate isomerase-like protein (cupin superfamily)